MKVVQLISSEGFYGAESMLLSLAEAQASNGLQTTVAVFADKRIAAYPEVAAKAVERGIDTRIVACAGRADWNAVEEIRELMEELDASVLHCHGYKADLYGFAASLRHRIPLVSTCHNWPDRRPSMRAYAAADRLVLRWFDQVTTPSRQVASVLEHSGVPRRKISTIANGIPLARFRDASSTLRRELADTLKAAPKYVLGCVARLIPGKGGAVLLQAAKTVLDAFPDTALVFVGEGECRQPWQALARDFGIADRVIFTGSRSDMTGVYASFDALVLPSFEEAMPMCLLEALASGCPVIATNVGEIPSLIQPDVTGLLVEPGDPAALAKAILQVLQHPERAAENAARGRLLVEQTYSSAAMARAYSGVYERALSSSAKLYPATARSTDSI